MTSPCDVQATGTIELYFYGELGADEYARVERHLSSCLECRRSLHELRVIRTALAARPDVSAPPAGDWSGFMSRLDRQLAQERRADAAGNVVVFGGAARPSAKPLVLGFVAMAAVLALVTISVLSVLEWRTGPPREQAAATDSTSGVSPGGQAAGEASPAAALAAVSEQHFERSKLVLLGLNAKDAEAALPEEWTYERQLATDLLSDTRLYRMSAEERGMTSLAGVLRDLEVVLLETSLTESDRHALGQIQNLIRKRNLLEKMEVVRTSGI